MGRRWKIKVNNSKWIEKIDHDNSCYSVLGRRKKEDIIDIYINLCQGSDLKLFFFSNICDLLMMETSFFSLIILQ